MQLLRRSLSPSLSLFLSLSLSHLQVRRINQIRDTQRKLDKQRRLLQDEEESLGGVNYQDYPGDLLPMESDKQGFRYDVLQS